MFIIIIKCDARAMAGLHRQLLLLFSLLLGTVMLEPCLSSSVNYYYLIYYCFEM